MKAVLSGKGLKERLERCSAVRSSCCSCRGPGFYAQHSHPAHNPPSTAPILGSLTPTSEGIRHEYGAHTYMHAKHSHTSNKTKNVLNFLSDHHDPNVWNLLQTPEMEPLEMIDRKLSLYHCC